MSKYFELISKTVLLLRGLIVGDGGSFLLNGHMYCWQLRPHSELIGHQNTYFDLSAPTIHKLLSLPNHGIWIEISRWNLQNGQMENPVFQLYLNPTGKGEHAFIYHVIVYQLKDTRPGAHNIHIYFG